MALKNFITDQLYLLKYSVGNQKKQLSATAIVRMTFILNPYLHKCTI